MATIPHATPIYAAYGEGIMYADTQGRTYPPLQTVINDINASGLNYIMLAQFHVYNDGKDVIHFNDTEIVNQGVYTGDTTWGSSLYNLLCNRSIMNISACISGDYNYLQKVYTNNNRSFANTMVEKNLIALKKAVPAITVIDLDNESTYDPDFFNAFCEMLISIGYDLSFCPYESMDFWVDALANISMYHPGAVKQFNLQCYSGGTGNDPQIWANAITSKMKNFNTDGFIIPGDWTEDGVCKIQGLLQSFSNERCVGGGFLWHLDSTYNSNNTKNPGDNTLKEYAEAIINGIAGEMCVLSSGTIG